MRSGRGLKGLKELLATDPEAVLRTSERVLAGSGAGTPVAWAEAALMVLHARQCLSVWNESDVELASEAIEIFRINDRTSECCELLDLRARLLFVKGRVKEAIADSLQAFHEQRASAEERLLGARVALMALTGNATSSVGRGLRHDVVKLARSTGPSAASLLALAYARYHDFVVMLAAARVPSGSVAVIGSDPSIGRDMLLDRIQSVRSELKSLSPPDALERLTDPQPFLLHVRLDAVEFPAGTWPHNLQQVRTRFGRAFEPHCRATEGLCRASTRDFQAAFNSITRAMQIFQQRGMPFMRIALLYPLALVQRECGDVTGALLSLDEFNANVWEKLTGVELPSESGRRDATEAVAGAAGLSPDLADLKKLQSEPPYLRRALRHIRERFADDITVQDIVASAGVSRRTLEIAMRTYRQTTPLAALRAKRLQEGRRLLMKQELSVKDVGMAVGYKSSSAFSRDFREYFGVAPKDARAGALLRHGEHQEGGGARSLPDKA